MNKSMCGCGCSIISSLMKRLGCSTCCSHLLSCSHTSEQLQRLSIECLNQPKKVIIFLILAISLKGCCIIWIYMIKRQILDLFDSFLDLEWLSNIILPLSGCVAIEMCCSNWFCNRIRWFTGCTDNHLLACSETWSTLMDVLIAASSCSKTARCSKM